MKTKNMKIKRMKTKACLTALLLIVCGNSHAIDYREHPKLVELVDTLVITDNYPLEELEKIFRGVRIDKEVILLINRQYEALPWYKYRARFINNARISKGVEYWNEHAATLARASQKFGVPEAIIVALIGVETHYGIRMGGKRVLDSLVTLSLGYPRRSKFFTKELRTFLSLMRTEKIVPASARGSYAGAIGIPQFMPTSYRAYAVDFNDNGQRDLIMEDDDAIGSVANYLDKNGWISGQSIFVALSPTIPPAAVKLIGESAKPKLNVSDLNVAGIKFNTQGASKKMALLRLKEKHGYRHIIGFNNFYSITRYNPSVNYALAVTELAQRISQQRGE